MSEVILILCFVELILLGIVFYLVLKGPREQGTISDTPVRRNAAKRQNLRKKKPKIHDDEYALAREKDDYEPNSQDKQRN